MNVVKEYVIEGTKVRIHNDYVGTEDKQKVKELLISLIINKIEK